MASSDPSYNAGVHINHGGAALVVESGGTVDALSGSTVDLAGTVKIGGIQVSATAAELNLLSSADRAIKVERVALAAVNTAGGVFAWTPAAASVVVGLYLDITTQTTGACTLDCGVAADATTLNDTLIDGVSAAAAGVKNSTKDAGTNGVSAVHVGATQYITGSVASGASAGIVGFAYIHYYAV